MKSLINIVRIMGKGLNSQHLSESFATQKRINYRKAPPEGHLINFPVRQMAASIPKLRGAAMNNDAIGGPVNDNILIFKPSS
ncbi:MAG: hypothetical protein HQL69_20955 [Magnetococcales bacterium]|nr:hypothetical protein [Magnetococcales bacterium]